LIDGVVGEPALLDEESEPAEPAEAWKKFIRWTDIKGMI
jgi:hypothetical protein